MIEQEQEYLSASQLGNLSKGRASGVFGGAGVGVDTGWGNFRFSRQDGCAEITIDRHLDGDAAKRLELVIRKFLAENEAQQTAAKEQAYRQAVNQANTVPRGF